MIWVEPKKLRKSEIDYTMCELPDEILAIIRVTWYDDTGAIQVDENVVMEDGQNGYDAFDILVSSALIGGANISIKSAYNPNDLGITSP